MLDPACVPPVSPGELLSRFVLFSSHVRRSDNSVKQDAFIPHPKPELSLTRQINATDSELWQEGDRVAQIRSCTLYGRAVLQASAFNDEDLTVVAKPIPANPNHADAINWPADKAAQKMKAVLIASKAEFIPTPTLLVIAKRLTRHVSPALSPQPHQNSTRSALGRFRQR